MDLVVLIGVALALMLLGQPVAIALGGSAVLTIVIFDLAPLEAVPTLVFSTTSKYTLLAVPFFMTAGLLLERSGIAERLVRLASLIVGRLKGGLAYVTIVAAAMFASMSGSGTADTAALATILLPPMERAGYKREFSAALIACGGSIGIILPPSIVYVLFGAITGASIGELFIAGIVPGLMIAAALAVPSYLATRRADLPGWERGSPRQVLGAARSASLGLLAPVLLLGGIYSGLFTPTEAAGVLVVYALLVGVLVYRTLRPRRLVRSITDAGLITSMAIIIVIGATLFSWVATRLGASAVLADAVLGISSDPVVIVLLLVLILFVADVFMDAISITFVLVPVFLPILNAAGVDLVWFGVVYCVTMAIGQVTPPIAVNLFIAASIARAPLGGVARAVVPMVLAESVVLLLVIAFPQLALWLPDLLR